MFTSGTSDSAIQMHENKETFEGATCFLKSKSLANALFMFRAETSGVHYMPQG